MSAHSNQAPGQAPGAPAGDGERNVRQQRNRMAGLWAAELLGLLGQAARDYAHDLAHTHDHDHDDGEKLAERLAQDLGGKVSRHEIREKLLHLLQQARRQFPHRSEPKP